MKSLKVLLLLLSAACSLQAEKSKHVSSSRKTPESGKPVSFIYDPAGGKLAAKTEITCAATRYVDAKSNIENLTLVRTGQCF